jgi:hypothetical protein
MKMPEDVHPEFMHDEERLTYFTLPMALNYQRNSYALREAATKTYEDKETKRVFDIDQSAKALSADLQQAFAAFNNPSIDHRLVKIVFAIVDRVAICLLGCSAILYLPNYDFLQLQQFVQKDYKKWFPYLSGPKIFHYWSYILGEYCDIVLTNKEYIEIAPDTHVLQCSVKLWVLTEDGASSLSRDQISQRRREKLAWSGINPIDMHSPLWFWSRNGFAYEL